MGLFSKVRLAKEFPYPLEVAHALDFFLWAALEDRHGAGNQTREFGQDEKLYNGILNRYLVGEDPVGGIPGPDYQLARPEGAEYFPRHFPDAITASPEMLEKSYLVTKHADNHVERLKTALSIAFPFDRTEESPRAPYLVQRDGYVSFLKRLLSSGASFASASPAQREAATVLAYRAALRPSGEVDDVWFTGGPVGALTTGDVKTLLPAFLEPEELIPSDRRALLTEGIPQLLSRLSASSSG